MRVDRPLLEVVLEEGRKEGKCRKGFSFSVRSEKGKLAKAEVEQGKEGKK